MAINNNLPPVFKDFSVGYSFDKNLNNQALLTNNNDTKQAISQEPKKAKKHIFAKTVGVLAGACLLTAYLIPFVRHKKFNLVNPNLVNTNANGGKFKKNFIMFSDALEVRRDMILGHLRIKINDLNTLIRKNFFSYLQETPVDHTKIKDFPITLVKSIMKELNALVALWHKLTGKINIDYTKFTNS